MGLALESELQGCLHQPGRRGVYYLAEQGAVDVSIYGGGAEEVGVIECIKALHAELQGPRFAKSKCFQ